MKGSNMRLYFIMFIVILIIVAVILLGVEKYEVSKEELLKSWGTKDIFYTMDKDSTKERTYMPYDLVSDSYHIKSVADVYNMSDFDSSVIRKEMGIKKKKKHSALHI